MPELPLPEVDRWQPQSVLLDQRWRRWSGKMSFGKKQFDSIDPQMRSLIPIFHHMMNELSTYIDADTNAYKDYVEAMKLPAETEEKKSLSREIALEAGIKQAISVPLNLARTVDKLWNPSKSLAQIINISVCIDLEVGVCCLELATKAAMFNVRTNLKDTKDEEYKKNTWKEMDELMKKSK